ncbi:MAG: tRNA uridine-5-carboxymethylaminomethyl(34) synthesis enzyme MnmG [Candidatus Omnitrophica bacterium]|nr:tRNA uridine-5-carboxymethylaminomethyl(34) synthesis enzyme MnmG [Candidatus Omnitrophota bacterium]MDD5027489.1 tRNA uridine-5-carboxymethylaminomethyl(34) synthesis enzyme MnmG [Candidatus Omnitrophota bacterium]MDD5662049.1 tRNA uridine-5-carboxymethylaminomethyl(34) synthesis enzyme MnmG [Candidatus Omnitrophota bacterium]
MNDYDIIVVGAGHAGLEAGLAASRLGCKTLMLVMDINSIGRLSCNPAIGGVGKGQLVKEIDALGGEMARAADTCGIQFRILNASKGAAVQSSRAQIDMDKYSRYMRELVKNTSGLEVKEAEVKKLIVKDSRARGVITARGEEIAAEAVVICPGTFLDGLIHIGLKHFSGGRINEAASEGLASNLKSLGFNLLRFKTGTCSRLDKKTIDYTRLIIQNGDELPRPFSFFNTVLTQKQIPCHITYTNKDTHKIILDNLSRSPLYTGVIKATGVRYCPSLEDKIVKFKDKARHQIFLEPQGLDSEEVYPNGISTSLPEDIQLKIIHSIEGLEGAKVIRFGYGIEHTVVEPTQLYPTLETKPVKNLYLAGQVNGTTGYEEAAAQGLVAGINAVLRVRNKEPLILDRSTSYIGVLIDDLTTKGTNEPYRMFTSRVEYRLILREDNADTRLSKIGHTLGLLDKEKYKRVQKKAKDIAAGISFLKNTRISPGIEVNTMFERLNTAALKKDISLEALLKRPQVSLKDIYGIGGLKIAIPESARQEIEVEVKYSGFIQRQLKDVEKFKNLEKIRIPGEIDYAKIPGLSAEIKEKLDKFKPFNLGQASRISGVTPAAISILMVYLRKFNG